MLPDRALRIITLQLSSTSATGTAKGSSLAVRFSVSSADLSVTFEALLVWSFPLHPLDVRQHLGLEPSVRLHASCRSAVCSS